MEVICPSAHVLIRREVNEPDKLFKIFQQSGQKFVQAIEQFQEPEGRSEVYACNFARDMGVQEIFAFFAICGDILQIRLLMDFSGYNRGKCFVLYRTVRSSRQAICCLNDELFGSSPIYVKLSLNNSELMLKHIPEDLSEEIITDWVTTYIGRGLETLDIKTSKHNPPEKIAFLIYSNHNSAIMAHKVAWPYVKIAGVAMDVHWVSPELFRKARNLYFCNYAANMSKFEFFDRITAIIVDVETIINIRIKIKYGYITFDCLKSMKKAFELLTGTTIIIQNHRIVFSRNPFKAEATIQNGTENGQVCQTQVMPSFPVPPPPGTLHVSAYPVCHQMYPPNYIPQHNYCVQVMYQHPHHNYMQPVVRVPTMTYYVPLGMTAMGSFGSAPVAIAPRGQVVSVAKSTAASTTVVTRMTTVFQSASANSSVVIKELDDLCEEQDEARCTGIDRDAASRNVNN